MLLNNIDEELTVVRKTERDTETYKFGVFPFSSHMNSQAIWYLFSQRFCCLKSCNPAAECLAEFQRRLLGLRNRQEGCNDYVKAAGYEETAWITQSVGRGCGVTLIALIAFPGDIQLLPRTVYMYYAAI